MNYCKWDNKTGTKSSAKITASSERGMKAHVVPKLVLFLYSSRYLTVLTYYAVICVVAPQARTQVLGFLRGLGSEVGRFLFFVEGSG